MRTIGIDLGFRHVKASTREEDFMFDSVVGYPSAIELQDEGQTIHPLDNIILEHENKTFYIGQKAIRDTKNAQLTFTADKTDNKTDTLKTMAALGYAMGDKKKEVFRVVSGLPVDELGINGLKEKMQTNLKKDYLFTFNGTEKEASIKDILIIAQSAGAYYDYILDTNGTIIEDKIKPKIVVIDIGFRTTDIVCMEDARYNPAESFTIYTGVHHIHNELRKKILNQLSIQKHLAEMDKITKEGHLIHQGESYSIESLLKESTTPYAEKILSELPLFIPNLSEVNLFLIAGGGSYLLVDFLSVLPASHEQVENASEANARGYHKYLKLLEANGK